MEKTPAPRVTRECSHSTVQGPGEDRRFSQEPPLPPRRSMSGSRDSLSLCNQQLPCQRHRRWPCLRAVERVRNHTRAKAWKRPSLCQEAEAPSADAPCGAVQNAESTCGAALWQTCFSGLSRVVINYIKMQVQVFLNVRGKKAEDQVCVLGPLPLDRVALGCHFTSRNLSFHFCKVERLTRPLNSYLEMNPLLHIAIVAAVSLSSV